MIRCNNIWAVWACMHSFLLSTLPSMQLDIRPALTVQGEVSRAEAASSAASGAVSGLSVGSDMLTPLIQRAKHQLEVERAKGGLHKAIAGAKTDTDLPQLEAAIQAARKAGVQERLQEASRYASWLNLPLVVKYRC